MAGRAISHFFTSSPAVVLDACVLCRYRQPAHTQLPRQLVHSIQLASDSAMKGKSSLPLLVVAVTALVAAWPALADTGAQLPLPILACVLAHPRARLSASIMRRRDCSDRLMCSWRLRMVYCPLRT